ncbi:MAG TPA: YicC family protein [Syntrophales bacterium]|nr:YicC family protein [Syntrophales bacterium]HQA83320.1 YicC family protein [Syntrophales bacterium]
MIKSMTGYGKAEAMLDGRKYAVEIRSLNHRYLEISLRLPGSLSSLETEIRRRVGERFSRGRIEVSVRVDTNGNMEEGRLELNLPLLKNYHDLLRRLKAEFQLSGDITLDHFTGFKDIFVPMEVDTDMELIAAQIGTVLDEAVRLLTEMRQKEGELLLVDLDEHIRRVEGCLNVIADRAPKCVQEYQRRLTERIRELTGGVDVDEIRLNQEVAIMADKSDVTEEIVRLASHISQFREMLKSGDAIGRKIDFLIQEMNREINTIGSKTGDLDISRNVIEIKSELGKLREQVQNIE